MPSIDSKAKAIPAGATVCLGTAGPVGFFMPRKPVEEWAKAKRHLAPPMVRPAPVMGQPWAPAMPDANAPSDRWLSDWQYAAAKAHEQWPMGLELSEAEYDDAVRRATGVSLR